MTALIKYDAACRALAEAKAVDEVKDLRDKAEAMRIYGMQAKNKALEVDAAEIRIRAERRLGEMLGQSDLHAGGRPKKTGRQSRLVSDGPDGMRSSPTTALPKLADAGISKDLSARAQKIAAVPAEEFEAQVGEWRERVVQEGVRVTTNLVAAGERAIAEATTIATPLEKHDEAPGPVVVEKPPTAAALAKAAKQEAKAVEENESLKARIADLEEELDEYKTNCADLRDEVKALSAAVDPNHARKFLEQTGYVRTLESQRDDLMNKNAQLIREVKNLRKKAGHA